MSYSSVVLATSGLQSYWRLNETSGSLASDSQGTISGTYINGPALNNLALLTGDTAKAPKFAAASFQSVDFGDHYGFTGTAAFSIECMVEVNASMLTTNKFARVWSKDWYRSGGSDTGGIGLQVFDNNDGNGGHIRFFRGGVGTDVLLPAYNSNSTFATAIAYHVVCTYDGSYQRMYVNGCMVGITADTSSVASPTGGVVDFRVANIGNIETGLNWLDGWVSEVAVYNVAVDAGTIYKHYRQSLNIVDTANNVHWAGAYVPAFYTAPYDSTNSLSVYNAMIGQNVAVENWYLDIANWVANWSTAVVNFVRGTSANLLITLNPYDSTNTSNITPYKLTNITAGNFDSTFTTIANNIKALGYDVYLRFGAEMNGSWNPWGCASGNANGNVPADFVNAWNHVRSVFTTAGATNIKWVWCPIAWYNGAALLSACYPGDANVDVIGIDGYNAGTDHSGVWRSGMDTFALTYQMAQAMASSKKIIIPEWGCSENGGSKSSWTTQFLSTDLPGNLLNIIGHLVTDQDQSGAPWNLSNWKVDSSAGAKTAYINATTGGKYADVPPFPEITSILPTSAAQSSSPPTVTVTGFGFNANCTGRFNANNRTTSSITATSLQMALVSADLATQGTFPVTITRSDNTSLSDPSNFTVTAPTGSNPTGPDTFSLVESGSLVGQESSPDSGTLTDTPVITSSGSNADLFSFLEASSVAGSSPAGADILSLVEITLVQKSLSGPVVNFVPTYLTGTHPPVNRNGVDLVDLDYRSGILGIDALGHPAMVRGADRAVSRLVKAYLTPKGSWVFEPDYGSRALPGLSLPNQVQLALSDVAYREAKRFIPSGISALRILSVQDNVDARQLAVYVIIYFSNNTTSEATILLQNG